MAAGKHLLCVIPAAIALWLSGCAAPRGGRTPLPDSEANRRAAADRYLQAFPSRQQMENLASMYADAAPPDQREATRRRVLDGVRAEVLDKATRSALVRNFTAAEIEAMAVFYAAPAGRGIAFKLPRYAAELMPPVSDELYRAMSPTNNTPAAALQWAARVQERDVAVDERAVRFAFAFTNTSPRTVAILSVMCPEIRLDALSNTNLAPGEAGAIAGTLDIGDRRGPQAQLIAVKSDDPVEPIAELAFLVNVPDLLRVEPAFLRWEPGDPPEPRAARVIRVATNHTVEIVGVECDTPAFEAEWRAGADSATNSLVVIPRPTGAPEEGVIRIKGRVDGRHERVWRVFARASGGERPAAPPAPFWGRPVLWIDARTRREFDAGHLPGALCLNQVEWESLIGPVLSAWRPGMPVVVYCSKGCRSSAVADRLREYGVKDVFTVLPAG